MALRFTTIPLSAGLRLHCAEQGEPNGMPVLFLHGWPDSWFSFSRVLAYLSPSFHAVVPDQRGFGDSAKPPDGYGIENLAADAVGLLDALGIQRAAVVGHSFGTFVARQIAASRPECVSRLVLIGTGWSPSNPVTREVQQAVSELEDPVPLAFAREFQAGTVHAAVPVPFFDRVVQESCKLPARLWRATFEGLLAFDDREALTRLSVPTLLLWGDRDALFTREDQDHLIASLPHATLEVYPDTGHCPNWERPERVAADLQRFLGEAIRETP